MTVVIFNLMKEFNKLLDIAKRKTSIDQNSTWSTGSETYFSGIKAEVDEVLEELPKSRTCYLEDELGDILWNYLNALTTLEKDMGLDTKAILERACFKYDERVTGIENGEKWSDIKEKQKLSLATEYKLTLT